MDRRPWALVLLAVLYCVSPLLYPAAVMIFFGTPLSAVAHETLQANSALRNIEIFLLPIVLGLTTFYARRWSYFVVLVGSVYLFARNLYVFVVTTDGVPVAGVIAANLLLAVVVAYFLRRSTRAIYFNAKMRWWETDPRYVVGIDAKLERVGGGAIPVRIRNIAIGGAALETSEIGFLPDERVELDFSAEGQTYRLAAAVVWEQSPAAGNARLVGIQWIESSRTKIREFIRGLKKKRNPTTRTLDRWEDFKSWASRPESS